MTSGEEGPDIGWLRAIGSGLVLLGAGIAVAVLGTNAILTRLTSVGRSGRQWIATVVFFAVIVAMAWALRRLQERNLI